MTVNAKGKAKQHSENMKAASARSQGDPVYVGQGEGMVDITPADDALIHCIAVADQDIASGAYGSYITKGTVTMTVPSATYVAGDGLLMLDGVVTSTGAAFPAAAGVAGEAQTVFGSIHTGGTTVTEIEVTLHGKPFTATT